MPRVKEFIVPGNVAPWEAGTWKLRAGELDETAEYAFTHGQCHAMAVALNELTGFELVGLGGFWGNGPGHFMVRAEFGYLLDVQGLHTEEQAYARFRKITEYDDGVRLAWQLAADKEYYPLRIEAARHFAKLVVDKYL